MTLEAPPINDVLAEQNGLPRVPWILFFNSVFEGDGGTSFTPEFTSLTTVGTPTFSGRYHRISQSMCMFFITITPGTSTTSVAGTTYVGNFPLTFSQDTFCLAVTGSGAIQAIGGVRSSDNRIYLPAWSAVTTPITIVGLGVTR